MYHFKNKKIHEKSFNVFDNAVSFFKKIKDGYITLEKAKQTN